MRYENVCLEGLAHVLPETVVSSAELEERLAPVYARHRLSVGRLELMTGIRERRFFAPGTRPSAVAAEAGRAALARAGVAAEEIGLVVHASVCRDFLEPATASVVHGALGLSPEAAAFDLSNACLGFLNALTVVADRIERGELEAGLVVSGEDGRPLVDATIAALTARPDDVTKAELKQAFASLTIGSGAAAAVLVRRAASRTGRRLAGGVARADTSQVHLCQGGVEHGAAGPLMTTDAEALLHAGNALAARTWGAFRNELGWSAGEVDRVVTHQVGVAHRRLLFETLELDPALDHPTVETLGNTGSAALPIALSLAAEAGRIPPNARVALLGIGSGLHCLMLGLET